MRILIDTNIIINLEDNKIIDDEFAEFYIYSIRNNCEILYHPDCIKDIKNDQDECRKSIILSKFKKYSKQSNPIKPDKFFLAKVGQKKSNDEIDNSQLYQVYKEYVEIFITEDKDLLAKAKKLNLAEKVMPIKIGLELLKKKFEKFQPAHPILKNGSVREIIHLRNSDFFKSLKDDYQVFDTWIEKCAKEDRKCLYIMEDVKIYALLIYNKEIPQEHKLDGIFEDTLKICTFKVSEDVFGYKIGELFINKMLEYAICNDINWVYLTVYPKHNILIELFENFGFYKKNIETGEHVLLKSLTKPSKDKIIENESIYHPFYRDDKKINKYIIPIKEKYYKTLFKDANSFNVEKLQYTLFSDTSRSNYREVEGNTIKKAYICKMKKNINKGDIIFFYLSGQKRIIETIGIVESVNYFNKIEDINEIIQLVYKRTVFSTQEILTFLQQTNKVFVILFRLVCYLSNPISYNLLKQYDTANNNFQTITLFKEEDYQKIKKKGFFDERYIVN